MENKSATFMDNINEETASEEIWAGINKVYGRISHLVNFKHHLLIYRLMKKKYASLDQMIEASGLSKQRIYQIINTFEKKEEERQTNG